MSLATCIGVQGLDGVAAAGGGGYVRLNKAAQFTSLNSEWLSIADNAALSTGDVDFWAAGWARFDSLGAIRCLATKGNGTFTNAEWQIIYNNATNRFVFSILRAPATQINVSANTFGAATTGTWYFVCVYHDSVNDLIGISVNGSAFDTAAAAGGPSDSTQAFRIGSLDGSIWFMDGRIDEVAFGKSPAGGVAALTTAIRDALYNAGNGLAYGEMTAGQKTAWGLVEYWDLDEASGTRVGAHGANDLTDNNTVTQAVGIA